MSSPRNAHISGSVPSLVSDIDTEEGTGIHIKHDTIPCPPPEDLIALSVPPANDVTVPANDTIPVKRPRGFAAISPERRREIASRGGKMAHLAGTAHEFTSDEARVAGRKGGIASHAAVRNRKAGR